MNKFRPAHEEILDKIESHCRNLEGIEKAISSGGAEHDGMSLSVADLTPGKCQEIGGLCSLLEVLEKMSIPEGELDGVIKKLKQLRYPHSYIGDVVKKLVGRKA